MDLLILVAIIKIIEKALDSKTSDSEDVLEIIKIFEAYNNDEESSFIVDKIKMLERDGYKKSEIAILYRNNFLSIK